MEIFDLIFMRQEQKLIMFIASLIILDKECISVTIKVPLSYVECK